MLSSKDKQWIKTTIAEVVVDALTVEWTIEKVRDEKTGQPLAVPEKITEKVFIPSAFLQILPYHEGALRGMQADVSKNNNKINDMDNKLSSVGNILIQTEKSLKCIAALSDHVKSLGFEPTEEVQLIGDIEDGKSNS